MRALLYDDALYVEALDELEPQFGNHAHVVRANMQTLFLFEPVCTGGDLTAVSALSDVLHCVVRFTR